MAHFTSTKAAYAGTGAALWAGLAFSAGWCHRLTAFGQAGWPLPTPEILGGLLIYRLSGGSLSAGGQCAYWLAVVPIAGTLWVTLLHLTAPYFGETLERLPEALRRYAFASTPLIALSAFVAVAAWRSNWGAWWTAGPSGPWAAATSQPGPWLAWVYVGGACLALVGQGVAYWTSQRMPLKKRLPHVLVCAALFAVLSAGLGTLARLVFAQGL